MHLKLSILSYPQENIQISLASTVIAKRNETLFLRLLFVGIQLQDSSIQVSFISGGPRIFLGRGGGAPTPDGGRNLLFGKILAEF